MMGFGGFGFIKNKPQVFNDNNIIFFENLQCINQCPHTIVFTVHIFYIADMYILLKNSFVTCLDRMIIHNLNTNICIHNLHAHLYCIHIYYMYLIVYHIFFMMLKENVQMSCHSITNFFAFFIHFFFNSLLSPIIFNEANIILNNN